jgi:hypothetical protein
MTKKNQKTKMIPKSFLMNSLNAAFLYGSHSDFIYLYDYFFDLLARFLLREPSYGIANQQLHHWV